MRLLTRSLSGHLATLLLLALSSVWVVTALGSAWQARIELHEGMDSTLVDTAQRLLDLALHDIDSDTAAGLTPHRPTTVSHDKSVYEDDHLIYQVVNGAGQILLRSVDAPEYPLDVPRGVGFTDLKGWRVFTARHSERPIYIHVAETEIHRQEAAREVILWLLLPPLVALPLLILLIYLVTRHALVPLQQFAQQIQMRHGQYLNPIEANAQPAELQGIANSTNHLLLRLSDALHTERALAANAAHELRTPLATALVRLRTLLCMPLDEPARAEAEQALESLQQLNRRAEKLLQLSRAESGAALAREPIDLCQLAYLVAQEYWNQPALIHRLHLQVPDGEPVMSLGDFDSLEIVLRNLIDNALHHCVEGDIHLSVEAPARLRVRDNGAGVPPQALQTIQRRHVRHTTGATGYGLGLSIVSTIVERHGGSLGLVSPPAGQDQGFEAIVQLRVPGRVEGLASRK